MTEQEAIAQFKERLAIEEYRQQIPKYYEAMELAVKSLEEIQQYRAIGTVKEIKIREAQAKRLSEGYLTNLGILREYQSIGTPEECRAAVEKQKAKKIVRVKLRQSEWGSEYRCPVCESDLIKTVFFNEDVTEPDEKYLGVQDVVRNQIGEMKNDITASNGKESL